MNRETIQPSFEFGPKNSANGEEHMSNLEVSNADEHESITKENLTKAMNDPSRNGKGQLVMLRETVDGKPQFGYMAEVPGFKSLMKSAFSDDEQKIFWKLLGIQSDSSPVQELSNVDHIEQDDENIIGYTEEGKPRYGQEPYDHSKGYQ